ncbi:hypothetical protein BKA67DRAFT_536935 [Truncatella angustata]|uniref:Uncharacterized protein n=1 Tax=Truncatella angustata TaxID=152316 RepID=A0A9P8UJN8_9PEZI|nr:uncharacterized protein BKA67DRAFT_536935 [Truncatella angustata]KAH6653248.1 hypothetical protein BKA67DRAFT_536935 [Truncatella angustata]KAH8194880.1 hypothetical protein TruAng_010960 [Truncatella angustata]
MLKLRVARCAACPTGEHCANCTEANIARLHKQWSAADRSDDVDKDIFNKLFTLRYGRTSINTAFYHKYFTNFSQSMKWRRESLGKYIDAICNGTLESMPLSSASIPSDAFTQLSTDDLLERCSELTRHLQKLHTELARRKQHEVFVSTQEPDEEDSYFADSAFSDVDLEETLAVSTQNTTLSATQLPTSPGSQPGSSLLEGQRVRNMFLKYWSEGDDPRAFRFVKIPFHTPRFLALLLDLARHYSWDQVTHMVNYAIIERVRHFRNSEDKDRYPKLDDWQRVLDVCSSLGFPLIKPEKLRKDDLVAINFRMTDKGLVKEGHSFIPYASRLGMCIERGPSCQPLPVGPRIFTRAYMMRCSEHDDG